MPAPNLSPARNLSQEGVAGDRPDDSRYLGKLRFVDQITLMAFLRQQDPYTLPGSAIDGMLAVYPEAPELEVAV
jgi:hypothetical protein